MSLPMTSLQAINAQKDEAKLAYKREQNALRNKRFLNARTRMIGVDVAALDQQVYEKQMGRDVERETSKFERLKSQELNRIMEAAAEEEGRLKTFYNEELKKSWEAAIAEKKSMSEPEVRGSEDDLSSFQRFSGEDSNRKERIQLQKKQMKTWVQEQVAEKAYQKYQENEERMKYAELLKQIDLVREESEKEEKLMSNMVKAQVVRENDAVNKIREAQRMTALEEHKADRCGLVMNLDEDQALAMDDNGRIIRKDAFKGFTPAQQRKILAENEALKQIKYMSAEQQASYERDWAMQQFLSSRAMEEAQLEEQSMRKAERDRHMEILSKQREYGQERRAKEVVDRFGHVREGFFNNFGKSCR